MRVVEFNARFGDPETQAILALLKTPLGALLYGAATGSLAEVGLPQWADESAVTVVMASENYPGSPVTGDLVEGLDRAEALDNVAVIHSGTGRDAAGRIVTAGGRVLAVTATGQTLAGARDRAYEAVGKISFRGAQYRTDIALDAVNGTVGQADR